MATRDWLPTAREEQLTMARDWKSVITANTAVWNIPAEALTALDTLLQTAETTLATARNETTRTPVATAQCRAAFEALTEKMRDLKRRYFLEPPRRGEQRLPRLAHRKRPRKTPRASTSHFSPSGKRTSSSLSLATAAKPPTLPCRSRPTF